MAHAATSPPLMIRARGPLACFTRPELKVERVSYPVMTPSAARGVLEAVLWKPAITWRIRAIHVLAPIVFTAFRRNEVTRRATAPARAVLESGGQVEHFFADSEDNRAQRNTIALRDVDYLIAADFAMTDRAGPADNVAKFVDMFTRRVEKGQHFHQPYFGCREFVADVLPPEGAPPPIAETRGFGLMLHDIEFGAKGNRPVFFDARLENGVLHVPPLPEREVAA